MKRRVWLGLMTASIVCGGCRSRVGSETKGEIDDKNAVAGFGVDSTYSYKDIARENALKGSMKDKPWSDTYWPLKDVGTAARWINVEAAPKVNKDWPKDYKSANYGADADKAIEAAIADAKNNSEDWQKSVFLSLSEKYDIANDDPRFTTFRRELNSYKNNFKNYEENSIPWGWMGHCHGWAPASHLYTPAPQHGVMLTSRNGKKTLFTPGDVRGLLTKGAADNKLDKSVAFMGDRCNQKNEDLLRDGRNRIVDGVLGLYDDKGFKYSKPIKIWRNNWFNHGELESRYVELVFQFGPSYTFSKKYWLTAHSWGDPNKPSRALLRVEIFSTKKDENGELVKDRLIASPYPTAPLGCPAESIDARNNKCNVKVSKKNRKKFVENVWAKIFNVTPNRVRVAGDDALNNYTYFRYQKECRDLNAGAFHVTLVKHLSEAGLGQGVEPQSFVYDITRDDQVWNHPVYQFESKIGQPQKIHDADGKKLYLQDSDGKSYADPYYIWRAPGTKSIVDVYTRMTYGVENGPKVNYAKEDDALAYKIYHYTLELDQDDKVIGGEWHGRIKEARWRWDEGAELKWFAGAKPEVGLALFKELHKLNTLPKKYDRWAERADSPDFAWMYKNGTKVGSGPYNGQIINKLYQCSIDEKLKKESHTIKTAIPDYYGRVQKGEEQVDYVECAL